MTKSQVARLLAYATGMVNQQLLLQRQAVQINERTRFCDPSSHQQIDFGNRNAALQWLRRTG
jgi:hypothetical protein